MKILNGLNREVASGFLTAVVSGMVHIVEQQNNSDYFIIINQMTVLFISFF